MSGEGKVAVLGAGLALVVAVAMCVGLSDDESSPRKSRHRHERIDPAAEPALEPEPDPEPQEPYDEEEEDSEPAGEGVRTLVGTVTDKRDELIEGAEVEVEGFSRLRDITGREGTYRLRSVPNEAVTLVVTVTGYAEKRITLEIGEPDSEEQVDVQLEDGKGVAGMVIDPEGQPVAGATVRCAGRSNDELKAETDRYGRFELSKRAAGCDGVAHHSGHADSPRVELRLGAGNLIALAQQGSINGVVVDGKGNPVRSFVLKLEEYRPEGEARGRRRYLQPYSNPRGRFSVSDLAPGTYVFSVTPRSGQAVRTKPIRVKSGQQVRDVRITIR